MLGTYGLNDNLLSCFELGALQSVLRGGKSALTGFVAVPGLAGRFDEQSPNPFTRRRLTHLFASSVFVARACAVF